MADGGIATGIVDLHTDAALIARLERLLLEALPRRMRLSQAAMALDVELGDLHAAFERQGLNPRLHWRLIRLHRLREDLATGRRATVAEAMVRWGFPPIGCAVTADYRSLFGRSPQDTLDAATRGSVPRSGPKIALRDWGLR